MLDPWAEGDVPKQFRPMSHERAASTAKDHDLEEVVTSAPPVIDSFWRAEPVAPLQPPLIHLAGTDLLGVEGLTDLPDDARDAFARQAVVHELRRNDEITNFALALVLDGSVEVSATIVDAPADRLETGAILRCRGTIDAVKPIRLTSAVNRARVATWGEKEVTEAFRSCPWVEDELRVAADRTQALVGATIGPLGERLDPALRADVISRMHLRVLDEHEVFAKAGAPIPGLLVVGGGELELFGPQGASEGRVLRSGDFLFPGEVLRGSPAPSSVRAAKGVALVLVADWGVAQELLLTCPPLLELFAEG